MNRREAVKAAGTLLGGAMVLGVLPGCGRGDAARSRSSEKVVIANCCALAKADEALLVAFADTVFPDTAASPGAKAAGVGPIMTMLVSECYTTADQRQVMDGIAALRTRAATFDTMPAQARHDLLVTIDAEAQRDPKHWFNALHQLAHQAYYASETGVTKALRFVMEPGGYTGCVPLTPGQPSWS